MKTYPVYTKLSIFLFGLLAFVCSYSDVSAQKINAYTTSTFKGNYQTIVGDGSSCTLSLPSTDDGISVSGTGGAVNTTVLPFNFAYDGNTYNAGSTMMFATNGFIVVGTNTGTSVPDGSRYGVAWNVNNAIMPFSCDLVITSGLYEVSGTSPNRVITFEWNNYYIYSINGYTTSMQLKLYETSNTIEFWYKDLGYTFNNASLPASGDPSAAIIGLQGNPYTTDNLYNNPSASALPKNNLRFVGIPPLNIQMDAEPRAIDFGFGLTGQTVDKQFTITHVGTEGTLTVNSISIVGNSDFTILAPLPPPLQAGQSANVTVRFIAQVDGVRTGTVTIVSNGKDSGKQTISLTAKGIAPNIQVDSTVLFKKTRTRLGDTLRQWIHITSVGQASLFLFSYPITGIDADQYFISAFPTSPIPPGGTDSLQVTYVPTREGLRAATLTINNNSFNQPALPITLRGTGILPHIALTPTIVLFDSTREGQQVCKTIDIWNPGSDTLKIKSNTLSSNDGDFQYTGLSSFTDLNIPPDQTRTVTICFTPLQRGIRQARLQIQTNIIKTYETPRRDTASLIFVDIRGTGVPFGVFANSFSGGPFNDSAFVGKQVCRLDTLKNTGDADILVKSVVIGGTNGNDFSYSGLPALPFILKAHSSLTFNICGTPDAQGALSGTATFTGTTAGSTITSVLDLNVFGIKACVSANPDKLFDTTVLPNNGSDSTLCVTVTNCGDIDAVYTVAINGLSKLDYTVTPSVSATVPAKTGTTTFCVTYKPTTAAPSPASLDIAAQDGSASVSIPLAGSAGCAVLTNDAPAVPTTGDNETALFSFNISNVNGTFLWIPGQESITGPGASAFSVTGVAPNPIPAGQSGVVNMKFHPAFGTQGSTLTAILTWPQAGPCGNALSVDLSGAVIQSSVKETEADGFSLNQTYPNPTQGKATFTYTTPKETEVRISLVDLTGKNIRTLITGRVSEGEHIVNFNAGEIPSGTYIYMLESGSTKLVRQLTITR